MPKISQLDKSVPPGVGPKFLQTVYAHFTLREWKIITDAITTVHRTDDECGNPVVIDDEIVTEAEVQALLVKCPSASL